MALCRICGTDIGSNRYCGNCGAAAGRYPAPSPSQMVKPQGGGISPAVSRPPAPPASQTISIQIDPGMGTSPLGPPCPKCQSQATELANFKAKRLSGSKIAAGVMTMGMSCLATGVSTKQKATWVCKVCKNSFTVKA